MTTTTTMKSTRRSSSCRGNTLIVAASFIVALTIMVTGSINAMGSIMANNVSMAARSDLVYAALGMVHMVKTDLTDDGSVSSNLAAYDMDGTDSTYSISATWNSETFSVIETRYRLTSGPGSGETTVTGRADKTVNGVTLSVEVSAVVTVVGGMPYDGYFGNGLTVGAGLTTNNPFGIYGDVDGAGTIGNNTLTFNDDVSVSGTFNPPSSAVTGTGSVNDGVDVPQISLDVDELLTDLNANPDLVVTTYTKDTAGLPGKGASPSKGIRLRFTSDGTVFISTTNANINATGNPFTSESEYSIPAGDAGAAYDLTNFQYVVVEGTYTQPITIVAEEGAIMLDANLQASDTTVPPIGLVAGGGGTAAETGNVMVRLKKNSQDYGISSGSTTTINATIYAENQFKGYTAGGSPSKATNVNFTGLLVAAGGGNDLNDISSNRSFTGPPVGTDLPPGITRDRFATSNPEPQFKTGSWSVDYNPN